MNFQPFSVISLQKENDLNKILKSQKKTGEAVYLLYTSFWDKTSEKLVRILRSKYGEGYKEGTRKLYVINSFTMPHSFVIFKTTKVPHLVVLGRKPVLSHDYLPHIYDALRI